MCREGLKSFQIINCGLNWRRERWRWGGRADAGVFSAHTKNWNKIKVKPISRTWFSSSPWFLSNSSAQWIDQFIKNKLFNSLDRRVLHLGLVCLHDGPTLYLLKQHVDKGNTLEPSASIVRFLLTNGFTSQFSVQSKGVLLTHLWLNIFLI